MADSKSWEKIFRDCRILEHNFGELPYAIYADQIKASCQDF